MFLFFVCSTAVVFCAGLPHLACCLCACLCVPVLQIAGDKLTQLAAQHWSEAARAKPDRPAFDPEIVKQIYKQELNGGNTKPPLLKRVMLLEVCVCAYVRLCLW